jgi:UDP-glucose 4-epimerase
MRVKYSRKTPPCVLVTGGTGYIGSHAVVALIEAGDQPIIVDNLVNSKKEVLNRICAITGHQPTFYRLDIRNASKLERVFRTHKFFGVIHFAGLKAVGDSVVEPLLYYENNVGGSISLFQMMSKYKVKRILFSSSAAVYGNVSRMPITEMAPTLPTNPYATTKLIIEKILQDIYVADSSWQIVSLRYFNPVGAHESALIGEDPQGIPNNLMPYISQVAVGRRKCIRVFGKDYPTQDGTGVRDYIHVMDLVEGHLAALKKIEKESRDRSRSKPWVINLGTGQGYSVLEMIHAFAAASGKKIPYKIAGRRPGDVAVCYADVTLAEKILGWKAKRNLLQMCTDTWRWQLKNPNGYQVQSLVHQ